MGQKPHLAVACLSSGPTGDNDTEFNFSRCICHAYTYLLLLHNLYQIYCLLDSSLLRQQLKNPESSEVTHWGSFGFQVLWAMSVQLAHEMEARWRQVSIWIPIFLTLIHHHENIGQFFEGNWESLVSGADLKSLVSWLGNSVSEVTKCCVLPCVL